jgi:hypothetical protein
MFAALIVGAVWKLGAAALPVVGPANTVLAAAVAEPVPPFAIATTPVTFAAVPLVLWLRVGKLVMFAALRAGAF